MGSIYRLLADLEAKGQPAVFCEILETKGSTPRHQGSKMVVYPDGSFTGTVGGGEVESRVIQEALEALKDGKPRLLHYAMVDPKRGDPGICGGQLEIFVEPLLSKPTLLVVGAGHVGKALTHLAKWLNFYVIVSDDREEFCQPEVVPEADRYVPVKLGALPEHISITDNTYIVLVTRGSDVDIEGLPVILDSPARYIGIIGSKRRWINTRKGLLEKGISEDSLNKIYSPIGLELGAETPEEIAVSIMAEIIAIQKDGSARNMKM